MRRFVCAILSITTLWLPRACGAAPLRAGTAQVDITPPSGTPMWGYARRRGPATGTLDPLMARVLVLEAGGRRLAIVTLDLGRPFGEAAIAKLRQQAAQTHSVAYVFVAASHTHSGPVILDHPQADPSAWENQALERILTAIGTACGGLQEARLGAGYGIAYIGHNRLRANPDGTVTWLDRNPTKIPTAPFDPTVGVLRVDTAGGAPLAILVNYACHPVVFGPDNRQFSADFPAVMAHTVEQAFSSHPVCLFLQGAAGDINPYYAVTTLAEDALARREWTGKQLGAEAVRVAKGIQTETGMADVLDYREDPLTFRLRWDPAKFREGMAEIFGPGFEKEFGPPIENEMSLPVSTVLIGKKIAIVGLPGEPFVDFQMNWRSRSPLHATFFAGYANGYHGYYPTIEAATLAGYGTASVTTWVEPGAGERMVDHALIRLYEMLGRLTNIPYRAPY